MDANEEIIVGQLKEGLEGAYKYIYDNYYTSLCQLANGYLKDTYQAETMNHYLKESQPGFRSGWQI